MLRSYPHHRPWVRWSPALLLLLVAPGAASAAAGRWQDKVDASVLAAAQAQGEAEFLIVLAEQADLAGAAALRSKEEKGAWVYGQLTAVAARTQAAVLAELERRGVPHRAFWIVNLIWARGDAATLEAVARRRDIAHLYASGSGTFDPPRAAAGGSHAPAGVEWNVGLINAEAVWAMGFTGQGVVVAGADTGVEWTHPALRDKYRGWEGSSADHDYNWHLGSIPNAVCPEFPSTEPCDDDQFLGGGHGTHTVGTMVGDDGLGNQIGVAPGARWMACRNMSHGVGIVPWYLDCMEWLLAPTDLQGQNPDPSKAPHVVNNSWGCVEGCPPPVLRAQVEASRAAGIVYVVSAGNDGPLCNTLVFPLAIYEPSFSVGATDINDAIADFSSRGPVVNDVPNPPRVGPDISAPGVNVRSSVKGGGYDSLSGTSMAGPHVAGLVALVISANPELAGDVDRIEEIIQQAAVPLTTTEGCGGDAPDQVPNNTFGWGRIDALAAVELALAEPSCTQIDDADPAVEYRTGWHRREHAAASGGGFHRRMGGAGGAIPTARVVFEGDEVTYFYAMSERGGTAEIFLDGQPVEILTYGPGGTGAEHPTFGHSRRYGGLGAGTHELAIEHRSGAVYADGFEFCAGAGADTGAAGFHSLTATDQASSQEGPLIQRRLDLGPDDVHLSVVVEGSLVPVTVRLRDALGQLLATGGSLLGGAASGLDAPIAAAGSYTVEVVNVPGAFEGVEIGTARTVAVP